MNEKKGSGRGARVAESISEKASGRPLSGREHEKTFVPPLHPRLEQCQSTSVTAIPYPYTGEQSNDS